MGVAYHGVRDAAEQSSPEASETAASQDDKVGVRILGKPNYLLVRIAERKMGVANLDPLVPLIPNAFVQKGPDLTLGALEVSLPTFPVLRPWVRSVAFGLEYAHDVEHGARGGRDLDRAPLGLARPLRSVKGEEDSSWQVISVATLATYNEHGAVGVTDDAL
jgi:hypothetical protein